MSINEFVEMTIFLYLICFSIYDKMQGFTDESGLFIFLLIFFMQKFKMAAKSGGKVIFCEKLPVDSADTLWVKNFVKIAGKQFLGKDAIDSAYTLWVKNFVEITLSRSVSEINSFLCLKQKFKMAAKSVGKTIFAKSLQ